MLFRLVTADAFGIIKRNGPQIFIRDRTGGRYCCIPGCRSCSWRKSKIHLVPSTSGKRYGVSTHDWAKKFHQILFKYRCDANFKMRVLNKKVFICSRHFLESDIIKTNCQSFIKVGALPTVNLPKQLHSATADCRKITLKPEAHLDSGPDLDLETALQQWEFSDDKQSIDNVFAIPPTPMIRLETENVICEIEEKLYHRNLDDLRQSAKQCLPETWQLQDAKDHILLYSKTTLGMLPRLMVKINESLQIFAVFHGWYATGTRVLNNIDVGRTLLPDMLQTVANLPICGGISMQDYKFNEDTMASHYRTSYSFIVDENEIPGPPSTQLVAVRSKKCDIFLQSEKKCQSCAGVEQRQLEESIKPLYFQRAVKGYFQRAVKESAKMEIEVPSKHRSCKRSIKSRNRDATGLSQKELKAKRKQKRKDLDARIISLLESLESKSKMSGNFQKKGTVKRKEHSLKRSKSQKKCSANSESRHILSSQENSRITDEVSVCASKRQKNDATPSQLAPISTGVGKDATLTSTHKSNKIDCDGSSTSIQQQPKHNRYSKDSTSASTYQSKALRKEKRRQEKKELDARIITLLESLDNRIKAPKSSREVSTLKEHEPTPNSSATKQSSTKCLNFEYRHSLDMNENYSVSSATTRDHLSEIQKNGNKTQFTPISKIVGADANLTMTQGLSEMVCESFAVSTQKQLKSDWSKDTDRATFFPKVVIKGKRRQNTRIISLPVPEPLESKIRNPGMSQISDASKDRDQISMSFATKVPTKSYLDQESKSRRLPESVQENSRVAANDEFSLPADILELWIKNDVTPAQVTPPVQLGKEDSFV